MGRGTKANTYPGNIKFRELIDENKQAYKALGSSNKKKKEFTEGILEYIKGYGGRFLTLTDVTKGESYMEISDDKARKKISQTFRDASLKKNDIN